MVDCRIIAVSQVTTWKGPLIYRIVANGAEFSYLTIRGFRTDVLIQHGTIVSIGMGWRKRAPGLFLFAEPWIRWYIIRLRVASLLLSAGVWKIVRSIHQNVLSETVPCPS
jgi:hypothetical protein